jgi:hypothetical protein
MSFGGMGRRHSYFAAKINEHLSPIAGDCGPCLQSKGLYRQSVCSRSIAIRAAMLILLHSWLLIGR